MYCNECKGMAMFYFLSSSFVVVLLLDMDYLLNLEMSSLSAYCEREGHGIVITCC